MKQLDKSRKRGCPTCNGMDPKSCMRCYGKTLICEWYKDDVGHIAIIKESEAKKQKAR